MSQPRQSNKSWESRLNSSMFLQAKVNLFLCEERVLEQRLLKVGVDGVADRTEGDDMLACKRPLTSSFP